MVTMLLERGCIEDAPSATGSRVFRRPEHHTFTAVVNAQGEAVLLNEGQIVPACNDVSLVSGLVDTWLVTPNAGQQRRGPHAGSTLRSTG